MDADRAVARWEDGLRRTSWALALRVGQIASSPGARHVRDQAARHPGRAVIVLGTVGWLLGMIGFQGRTRPAGRVTVPPEYVVLAGRLADAWRTGRDGPEGADGEAQGLAELRNAALDLAPLRPADPDIAAVVAEARAVFDEGAASMERFLALPRPPGVLDSAAEGFMHGFLLDLAGATRQHDRMLGVRDDRLAEGRRTVAVLRRGEAAKLMLPRLAARHAGPIREGGPALAVDLDEAWGPFGPGDWLTLTNASGVDLHNATVLVEVRGEAGDVAPSVHFVPSWTAGTAIQACYTRGVMLLDFAADRQTVVNVASVAASLWSEELRQESIAIAHVGAGRDADVARYCSAMRVRASFRPFEPGVLWNTERGMELWLDGIDWLPGPRVTATFRRGGDVLALFWDFPRWNRGERKVVDAGKALPWDPETVTIEVAFSQTGYKFRTEWPER